MSGAKRRRQVTCEQCGAKWSTVMVHITYRCARCRRKNGNLVPEPQLSPGEVERILSEAVANELRMPWEKTNR